MNELPVDPTEDQIQAVLHDERDGPVVMLNLNRYRDRDTYLRYGIVALAAIESVGGRILWQSEVEQTVIGDERDRYDEAIAVWYPSRAAFLGLMDHPGYLAATAHRVAGLEHATLLALTPPG
ncbi:MAG TPA: DUF1330 domain-containing protein [Acidimicrobiales bacterium]|nr:DUF1330 domain-containing protein [Acidimicrobiales bacterium]